MTKVKLHFDGWLALPAAIRRRMGVTTGDQLEVEWTDGGLLLRSPGAAQSEDAHDKPEVEAETIVLEAPAVAKKPPAKKTAVKKPVAAPKSKPSGTRARPTGKLAASTIPKARGRRKAATA